MSVRTVKVKPAKKSKINWTQIITAISIILSFVGVDLDAETQTAVVTAIAAVGVVVTWILRTWFNDTVTPS